MPVAAVGAIAAASSVAAAGGIAAVGAGIMAGSLGALAAGAMVVGSALTIAGKITGSKTLGKIGMGFTLAGGVGGLAAGARGATGAAASAEGSAAEGLAVAGKDLSVAELAAESRTTGGLLAGNAAKTGQAAGDVSRQLWDGSTAIPDVSNLATEPNIMARINTSLNKYNGAMNVVGGMGDAYMENQRTEAFISQSNKDRDLKRGIDERNYAGTAGAMPQRNVNFNPESRGLLRGNTTIPNIIPAR